MKRFEDLTREEKLALTEEQVNYYAKLECADRGIIIPQKPINEIKSIEFPTEKFYQVGYESFVFRTEQDAQDFIDAKSKALTIKSIGGSYEAKNQYVDSLIDGYKEVRTVNLYTKEQAMELKDIIQYNTETQKEWKEYNENLNSFESIRRSMWDDIYDIHFYDTRVVHYNNIFNEYLSLAQNNQETALTFFKKAYAEAKLTEIDRQIVDTMLQKAQ